MALALPVLILLLTGIFDIGFAAYDLLQVDAAAAAGARFAADSGWAPDQIAAAVTSATGIPGIAATPAPSQFCACPATGSLAAVSCAGSCPDGRPPSLYGLISAQLQYTPIVPYPGLPGAMPLTARAVVRLQ